MLLMEGSKAEDSKEKLASAQMGKRGTDRKGNDRDDIWTNSKPSIEASPALWPILDDSFALAFIHAIAHARLW